MFFLLDKIINNQKISRKIEKKVYIIIQYNYQNKKYN